MKPAKHNLPSVFEGERWRGIGMARVWVNQAAPRVALAEVQLQFRVDEDAIDPLLTLSSVSGGCVIVDSVRWEFKVPEQTLPLSARSYYVRLRLRGAGEEAVTWLIGHMRVLR